MGYTHYFENNKKLNKTSFLDFVGDVRKLTKDSRDVIQFENDVEAPIHISTKAIRFNGIGKLGHETFELTPKKGREFCKTAFKPYNKYVVGVLILAKIHFGDDISLGSDGCTEEWNEGKQLVIDKVGLSIPIDLYSFG